MIEGKYIGGTCVNVGCVPKKVMFNAANFIEDSHKMYNYGFNSNINFDFKTLKNNRDSLVKRLNNIYNNLLSNNNVDLYNGFGEFEDVNKVRVNDKVLHGDKILISTGSKPMIAKFIKG